MNYDHLPPVFALRLINKQNLATSTGRIYIMKILKLLFCNNVGEPGGSLAVLVLRFGLSLAMLSHGLSKLADFSELWSKFPDPLGFGSGLSLILAIFAEVFCSIAILLGLLTRLSILPLITTMSVAFFVVHRTDDFGGSKELALVYLVGFIAIFLSGPGMFSFDNLIGRHFSKKKTPETEKKVEK